MPAISKTGDVTSIGSNVRLELARKRLDVPLPPVPAILDDAGRVLVPAKPEQIYSDEVLAWYVYELRPVEPGEPTTETHRWAEVGLFDVYEDALNAGLALAA